jgi:hypothetical protein
MAVLIPTQMQIMHFSIVLFSSSYASVSAACTLYTNICANPLLWLLALKYADAQKLKPAQTLSRPPRPFPFPTLSFFHPPLLFFLSVCLSLGCLICKKACLPLHLHVRAGPDATPAYDKHRHLQLGCRRRYVSAYNSCIFKCNYST